MVVEVVVTKKSSSGAPPRARGAPRRACLAVGAATAAATTCLLHICAPVEVASLHPSSAVVTSSTTSSAVDDDVTIAPSTTPAAKTSSPSFPTRKANSSPTSSSSSTNKTKSAKLVGLGASRPGDGAKVAQWMKNMGEKAQIEEGADTGGYNQIADVFRGDASPETAISKMREDFSHFNEETGEEEEGEVGEALWRGISFFSKWAYTTAIEAHEVTEVLEKVLSHATMHGIVETFGFDLFGTVVSGGVALIEAINEAKMEAALEEIEQQLSQISVQLNDLIQRDFNTKVNTFNTTVSRFQTIYKLLGQPDDTFYNDLEIFFSDKNVAQHPDTIGEKLRQLKDDASDPERAIYLPIGDRFMEMIYYYDMNCGKSDQLFTSLSSNVKSLVEGGQQNVKTVGELFDEYEQVMQLFHDQLEEKASSLRPKDLLQILPAMEAVYARMLQALFIKFRAAQFWASMGKESQESLSLPLGGSFRPSESDLPQDRFESSGRAIAISDVRRQILQKDNTKIATEHQVVDAYYALLFRRAFLIYSKVYDLTTTEGRLGALQFTVCNNSGHDIPEHFAGTGYVSSFVPIADGPSRSSTTFSFEEGKVTENRDWKNNSKCSTFTPTEFGADSIYIETVTSRDEGDVRYERNVGFYHALQSPERRVVKLNITDVEVAWYCSGVGSVDLNFCIGNWRQSVSDIKSGTAEVDADSLMMLSRAGAQTPSAIDPSQTVAIQSASSGNRFSILYNSRLQHASLQQAVQVDPKYIQSGENGGDSFQWRLVSNPYRDVTFEEMKEEKKVDIVQIQSALSGYSLVESSNALVELVDLGTEQGLRYFSAGASDEEKENSPACWWYMRVERSQAAQKDEATGKEVAPAKVWYSFQNVKTGKYLNATDSDVETVGMKSSDVDGSHTDSQFLVESIQSIAPMN